MQIAMSSIDFLLELEKIIDNRLRDKPENSYTWRLVSQGIEKVCEKVIEEAGEVVIATLREGKDRVIEECADLIYHLLVLLRVSDISIVDVVRRLEERHIKMSRK